MPLPEPPAPPASAPPDARPNPSGPGAPALAAAAPDAPTPATAAPGSRLADYDFSLPPELIAQRPPDVRGASRLLHVDPAGVPRFRDRRFADLVGLLAPGDLLVMNDTRVVKARLFGSKATGGRVEVLVERIEGPQEAVAMIRSSHPPPTGSTLSFDGAGATVLARDGAFFRLRFDVPVPELLERAGSLPLPPYIQHVPDAQDSARYQTVYAAHPGAVAAPTAGLHFDDALLGTLAERGVGRAFVTLHVGAGTFMPVRDEDPARHVMHAERYHVPADTAEAIEATRALGGRIVAVGTTSLRTLEAAASDDGRITAGHGETALYIRPGYRFRAVDRLLTNFHLPRSTLMMLVSAFSGLETIRAAYAHAIEHRYRFFSYGDAMLLERARPSEAGTRE